MGYLCNERLSCRLLAKLGRQIFMPSRFGQGFYPSEEIKLEVANSDRGCTESLTICLIQRLIVEVLSLDLTARSQRGQRVSVSKAVLCSSLIYTQHSNGIVPVVLQASDRQHFELAAAVQPV
ncbi:hypothetical protein PA6566_01205 [Pseudomonas aeruginosa]